MIAGWHSIRLRLAALSAGAIALLGLVIGGLVDLRMRAELERSDAEFADHETIEVAQVLRRASTVEECRALVLAPDSHLWPEEDVLRLEVFDLSGRTVAVLPVGAESVTWPEGLEEARRGGLPVAPCAGPSGSAALRAAKLLQIDGAPRWIVLAEIDRRKSLDALSDFHGSLLLVIPLAAAAGFLGSFGLITLALRPLGRVVDDARRLSVDGLGRRLEEPPPGSELSELVRLLNVMLARLEENVARLQRFAADASHELRTPLARIRGEAEVALRAGDPGVARDALGSVVEEVDGLRRLIDGLLQLARGDEAPIGVEVFDLAPLVGQLAEEARLLGEPAGLTVEDQLPSAGAPVRGSKDLVASAVWNLLGNALRHVPRGGRVQVRLHTDGLARVEVRDDGPGIAPQLEGRLFQAFMRGDEARADGGLGLGLALGRTIARRHGGELRYQHTPGGGATFVLELPLARS